MKQQRRFFALVIVILVVLAMVSVVFSQEAEKININKASVEELMQLKRIGQKYAERIVEYRETNGPFEHPEDIMKVKGIGAKTFEMNKDRITVEESEEQK